MAKKKPEVKFITGDCAKCGTKPPHGLKWDVRTGNVVVICNRCGFAWRVRPLDSLKTDPA